MVIAILAAIVASQAMITSTFQLLVQVMRLSYFPHIKVVHTSKRFHEQVYMPHGQLAPDDRYRHCHGCVQ